MSTSAIAVRRKAREVLARAGLTAVPVDVEELIHGRGLSLQEVPAIRPGVFGAFFIDGVDAGIMVSAECFSPGHRRFTLAHELGHFVLEGHVDELLPPGSTLAVSQGGNFRDQKKAVEREADIFAAELLMPSDGLPSYLGPPSLDGIRRLADACDASLSSAAIRMMDLLDTPAAVILSHDRAIEWYAASAVLREHGWARRPLKGEWVPQGSATQRLLSDSGLSTRGTEEDRQSLLLCEWFDEAPPLSRVEEECASMGRYGRILTLLTPIDLASADEEEEARQRASDRQRERDWRDASRPWSWD